MSPKRRNIIIAVSVLFVLAVAGISYSIGHLQDITLSQEMIQGKVNEKLPMTQQAKLATIEIKNANIGFVEGQIQVELSGSVTEKLRGNSADFTTYTRGTLIYNDSNGNFYFKNPGVEIRELSVKGEEVKKYRKETVGAAISAAASVYLNHLPLYRLPSNFKGQAVRVVLKSIEINDGSITIHLSLWKLTKTIFAYLAAGLFCIAMLVLAIVNPEAFENLTKILPGS
jgi:hypothetical protein